MKKIKLFLRVLGLLALLPGFNLSQAQEYTGWLTYPVPINEANFPDTNFRAYIAESFDINRDGELSEEECLAVQKIDVSSRQIKSLRGICRFIELRDLNASDNLLEYNSDDWEHGGESLPPFPGEAYETWLCCGMLENIDFSGNPGIESFVIEYAWPGPCLVSYASGDCAVRKTESIHYNLSNCHNLHQLSWWIYENRPCFLDFLDISNTGVKTLNSYTLFEGRLPECPLFGMNLDGVTITNSDIAEIINGIVEIKRIKTINMGGRYFYNLSHISGFKPDRVSDLSESTILVGHFLYPTIQTDTLEVSYVYNTGGVLEDGTPVRIRCHLKLCNYTVYTDAPSENIGNIDALFPDTHFASYVKENIDANHDGLLNKIEVLNARELNLTESGIEDLTGIEHFDQIRTLNCSGNNIEEAILDSFLFLSSISMHDNPNLKRIELSCLESLKEVKIGNNPALENLQVDNCPTLPKFDCSNNTLASLELSNLPLLRDLDCSNNTLASLELSNLPALLFLNCSNNALASLELSNLPALLFLNCSNNALLDLDVRRNLDLQVLDCSKNQLASLDLFRNTSLTSVKADSNYREVVVNQDRQFDISTLPRFERARMEEIEGGILQGDILTFEQDEVRYFYSYNNWNPELPLGEYFYLKAIQDSSAAQDSSVFIAINETNFPDALFRDYIAENADMDADGQLSELEVSGVTGIDVPGMGIQDLRGIEYFTELEILDCSGNELTSLDLSANAKLQSLNAENNRLDIVLDERDRFDLSQLPGFEMAKASDWTGCTRIGSNLTFKQQEVTYSYATGYNGESEDADMTSVIFSLMADRDPSVEPDPGPGTDNEADARQSQGRVYAKNHRICTEGIEGEISIYSASGSLLYQGFDQEIPVRHDGLYLVRSGARTWKVLVM